MAQQNGTGWQPITGGVLPNNPINKLNGINQGVTNINNTPMNNANINTSAPMSIRPDLINSTQTPVQQNTLQPITNTTGDTNTNSRFVGFQSPTNNNLNKWENPIMWQSTSKRDNTVTTNTKQKEKWNVPTLRDQVNTHNNNVTQTLRDFQKAVHDTNGGLTAEMIQQAFPEYDVNEALNLQQELMPIVVGKGTYANIDEIEKYYPSLIKRYNFEELNNEYQQTSKSNKRAIEAVNNLSESDYNKLSTDGKKYYEIVLKMEAAVEGIKDKYDVPKETSDAEILNRAINFDPELKSEVAQLQTLNLTGLDKAYLKLDTNWINNIAKLTNDAVNWVNDKYQQNISQPLEELATTQAPHLAGVSGLANAIGIIPQTLAEVSNAFMHVNKPYESPSGDSDISEIAPQVFSDIVEVSFPLIFEFIAAKYPNATMLFESPLGQPTSTVEGHNFGKTVGDWFERAKNNITGPILEATVMNTPYWDNMTEEAQEYIKNAIPLLFAHFISKGGEKVLKSDTFQAGLKVTGDLIGRAAKEGRDSARFQKYVEDGLNRIEGGEVYDEKGNKIGRAVEQGDLSREQRWRIIKEGYKGAKDSVQDSMKNLGKDYETAKNEARTFKDLQEQLNKTRGEIDDLKDEIIDDQLKGTKEKSTGVIKEKDTALKEVDEELKNIDKDKTLIEKGANEIAGISDDIKDNPFFSSDSTKMIEAVKEDGGLDIAEYQTRQYEQILDFIADRINDAINTKNKEVGPLYDVAVQQNVPVILDNIVKGALDIIRNNDGISYNNGVLEFLDDRFSGKEQKALQGIVDRLLNPDTDWNTSTLWDVRKYADLNAKWGTSATTDGISIIRDLRRVIDDGLRDQVPGFKDIDTEYVNAIDTLDELSGKLTLKKAKPGTLRENAVSTVKNLLNPSNRLYLNRLEKLIPGITQKLQSIKNLRQVYNAYVKGNTSGFTAGIENAIGNKVTSTVGGLIGASGGIPGAMLGYLIGRGLEKSIKGIKKAAVEKVAKTITPKARLELKKIAARIEEGKKLTADQKKRLEEIKNKIIVEGDKVKKTREQERAWKEEKARIERERNNFIDKVEEGTLDNALPYNKNAGDGGKTIITGNDKTIVTDNKGKSQKKSGVTETNSEGELKGEKTKQQRLKEGIIKARTDKAEDSLKRLEASLNVLKDKKDLTEVQIDLLRKDAERLRDDINKLEIRGGVEAPQEMVDTLNKAYDLLRENGYETTVESGKTAITGEGKTAITGTAEKPTTSGKTAVLDKTETPQKTAQNIIQDAQNVEKGKQLPTNPETKNGKPVVIDSKGNAKDFYHGTPNGGFTEFDIEKRGTSNDFSSFGDYGRGIYFTPYKEDAENYATKNTKVEGKTPTVYKVKLYMANPLRLDILANIQKDSYNIEGNPVQNANWNNEFKKILDKYGYTEEQYEKDHSMGDSLYDNWGDWDIRAQGYDGVVSPDGREWIVTDVNQIQTLEYESKKPSKTAITGGKVTQNKEEVKNAENEGEKQVKNVKKNKLTPIEAFREETAKYEPDYDSIEADAKALAEDILTNAGIDAEVVDLVFTGSKARGIEHENSDDDILIEIKSNNGERLREDDLFNLLNDKDFNDNIYDFNPIVEEDSGDTLETKVVEQEKYMKDKKEIKELLDKEGVKRDKDTADSVGVLTKTNRQLLKEFLQKTEGPIWFHGEKGTVMASADLIGDTVYFTIGSDGGWSPAMKSLLDKINKARKSKAPSKTQITDNKKSTDEVHSNKGEPTESVPGNKVHITDEISREVSTNLKELKEEIQKNPPSATEFLRRIKKVFPVKNPDSNSIYPDIDIDEGNYTLRISRHSTHAFLAKQYGNVKNNTSIVIKLDTNSEFKPYPGVETKEYVYFRDKLDLKKMLGIIKGIQDWLKTGEYTDKNYNEFNESPKQERKSKNIENVGVEQEVQELLKYNGLLSFHDGISYSDNVFGDYTYTYETNRIHSQGVLIAKMNTQQPISIEVGDRLLEEQLERAIMEGEMALDINGNFINHSNYDGIEIYDSVSSESDGKPTSGTRIITFMKLAKHSDEREFGGRMLLSRFLKEYGEKIQKAQPETTKKVSKTAITQSKKESKKQEKKQQYQRNDNEIQGKFRNLTLQDYMDMKEFEGLEDFYAGNEAQDIKKYLNIVDTLDALRNTSDAIQGAYEWNNSKFNIREYQIDLLDKDVKRAIKRFVEYYDLSERIEKGTTTTEDANKYSFWVDDYDEKTKKPDWNIEYVMEETKDEVQNIFTEDVYNPFIEDFYREYGRQLKKDNTKDIQEKMYKFNNLVNKYGKWWEQSSLDNSQNNVIISSSNTPLTSNNIKDGGNKENSRGNNEGHKELSDTKQNVQQNDKITKAATDKGDLSRITQTQNNSGDNSSEHGTGSTNGRSKSTIREKGDNIITDKTVTQARDINRESVNILEKHDYSTNPNDYTKEEIDTLRQYEGRGGVNDKEDSKTQGALNQYYTKDNIIKAMWRLVDKYRPKEGNLKTIEPSMGVGRFFLYAPEGSDLYGFEYDKVPGTIAKILFPNANITIGDFQDNFMVGKFSMGDNYTGKKYDVVIGNPPYEERQGRQRGLGEEPKITRFDDYFIKRGIDMLEDGGILLFVTSSQFLRGADNYAKQKISENAELIDAYRIPIGAFDRTQVETDIVVFKKTKDGGDKNLLSASEWFIQNPDKILGEERNDIQGRFGPKTGVVGDLSAIDEIAAVKVGTDGLPAKIEKTFTPTKETTNEQKTEKNAPKKKVKAKKTVDPTQWQDWTEIRVNDKGEQETIVWGKSLNGVIFKGKGGPTGTMVVGKGGIGKYQKVLNANGKIGDPDIKLENDREGLNYINGELEPNILYASGHIPSKLQQLEIDYEGGFIDDAQYNKQKDLLEKAKPEPKAFQDIYFSPYADRVLDTETDTISSEYEYGQGVVDKKQTVRKLFRKRVQEREKSFGNVIHIKKTKDGIEYETQSVGQGMLGILDKNSSKVSQEQKNAIVTKMPKAFNEFIKSNEIDEAAKIRLQDQFNKKYNSYANFEYDELGYTVEDISNTFMGKEFNTSDVQTRGIARILTTEAMIIAHGVGQGKTIEGIIGAIASMQQGKAKKAIIVIPAGTKASRMQTVASLFPNQEMIDLGSLAGTSGIRKRLAETYGPDPRDWIQDGQLVFLEHSAVGNQISFKPDTLSLLEQRLTDAMESSFDTEKDIAEKKKRLASLEEKQDSGKLSAAQIEKNNKQIENLLGEIEKLGRTTADLPSILKKYVGKGLDEAGVNKAIELIDNDYDYYKSEMEKYIDSSDSIEDKAKAKEIADSIFINERAIYLEDLGVDHITVDEAHNFRNLFKKALQEDDEGNASFHAGLNAGEGSKAAKNLYAMTQYIMSINGGGNVILLTATPFINNPSEVYNMLSYVGKNGMAEMGVTSMDDFYDNYVGLENKLTPTASASGVGYKNVMVQFNNTDTLIKNLLDRYIDYEGESSAIVKPRLNTVVARLKMGEEQQYIENLLEEQIDTNKYIDTYKGKDLGIMRKTNDKGEEQGAVIEGMTQANLNLISPYLTKYKKSELPTLTVDEMLRTSPKLQAVVEIAKRQRNAGIMRGTFIYMPDGKVLHELLKEALEKAIPGVKVGIINGDTKYKDLTETQAKKLGLGTGKGAKARLTGKQFHDGEIDILIGGDNTKEGLNLQGNGYMTIEVSQPRNANDRIQLLGRIWRQGNLSNEVIDVLLLMENSSDIYRFELMSRKNSRWSLLEMLSSYKKGEKLEDVRPQTELDMNEEKMALFTDPEKKAKVSIAMDSAKLEDDVAQLEGQIDSVTKIVENISNWGGYYGTYKEMPEAGYKSYLNDRRDSEGKPIMTSIFDEKALEPLEEQLQYHYDQAYRDLSMENERYERGRSKADIDKKIKKNNPYYNSSSNYNSIRERLSLARGVRNSVLRQTEALGIKTVEGLTKYLDELNQQKEKTKETIKNIESTLAERTEEYKRIQEANKENEMSIESILEDITEEFKHQITLGSKDELKNWIELTKDLPKREQAKNKTAITEGKNRYIWQSKDYVGKQATFNKPKNLITSQFTEYTEQNPKPEIKYVGYVPKEVIKKVDGSQLTKIGYQSQFRQLASKIDEIEHRAERNAENNWKLDEQEILDKDSYYQSLKKRILNLMLKFAKNFEDEIIKAFKKDNPGKTYATAEDFYDYINDYQPLEDGKVSKIKDKYIKEGAEYLANKFNGNNGNSKNVITANENNKITDY